MSILFHPLKITELVSFAWAGLKLLTEDCYRYFYREEVIVRIKAGQVKGYKIATSYNYQYYNFLGIPYAKPPIGKLRFKVCTKNPKFYHWNYKIWFVFIFGIGAPTIRTIKWCYQWEICTPWINGMSTGFINYTNHSGNGKLSTFISVYTWHSAKCIEASNCLDSWWCIHLWIKFQRYF